MATKHTYELQVKHVAAAPTPWKWEIFRDDEIKPFERSVETYRSRDECERAGRTVLMRLRNE